MPSKGLSEQTHPENQESILLGTGYRLIMSGIAMARKDGGKSRGFLF
jgi:hypothetical protein